MIKNSDFRILVVTDETSILSFFSKLFSRQYKLNFARTDREALRMASGDECRLIFLSVKFSDICGMDLSTELKRLNPMATIVVMNGCQEETKIVTGTKGVVEKQLALSEKHKEIMTNFKLRHPGYFSDYGKKYRAANKDLLKKKYRQWYMANKVTRYNIRHAYYLKNREKIINAAKKWYANKKIKEFSVAQRQKLTEVSSGQIQN